MFFSGSAKPSRGLRHNLTGNVVIDFCSNLINFGQHRYIDEDCACDSRDIVSLDDGSSRGLKNPQRQHIAPAGGEFAVP